MDKASGSRGGGGAHIPEDGGGAKRKVLGKLSTDVVISVLSFLDDKSTANTSKVSHGYLAAGKVASNLRKDNFINHILQLKNLLVKAGAENQAKDLDDIIDEIKNHPKAIFLEKDIAMWREEIADSLLVLEPEERTALFTMVDVHNNDTFRYLLNPDEVITEKLKDRPWAEGLGAFLEEHVNDTNRRCIKVEEIIDANPNISADDILLLYNTIPDEDLQPKAQLLITKIIPKLLKENRADIIASMIKTTSEGAKFLLQIASHVLLGEDSLITNLCAYHNTPRDEKMDELVSYLTSLME